MYPNDWEVHSIYYNDTYEDGSNQKVDLEQTPYINLYSPNFEQIIRFEEENYQYKDKGFEENAKQWLTYYLSSTAGLGNSNPNILSKEKYVVGKNEGLKYTISYQYPGLEKPGTTIWIYLPLEGKHLLSIKYSSEKIDSSELELYSQILSTFEFIEEVY